MALIDCFGKLFKADEILEFQKRSKELQKQGMSEKEADIKVVRDAMGEIQNTMKSVYEQVGNPYSPKTNINEQEKGQKGLLTPEGTGAKDVESIAPEPSPEPEMIGITHAQMDDVARELGLPTYERNPETFAEWDAQAREQLSKDPDALQKLTDKLRNGDTPDKVETRMMIMHMADLKARYNKAPTPELLEQIKRTKDLYNIAGREQGKALVARKAEVPVEETLADFHLRDIEYNRNAPLTETQKAQSTKEYQDISSAKEAFANKTTKLKAEQEFESVKKSTGVKKRTPEEFAKERNSLIEKLKAQKEAHLQMLKDKGIQQMGGLGGIVLTPEMAKTIGQIVKLYVENGVSKLEDVVKSVHEYAKEVFEGITEGDIHNVISGMYAEKKQTRNEVAATLFDLRTQASLINKLEKLESGIEPKNEKQRIKRNQDIEDLKSKIKEHDLTKLSAYKSRLKSEIEKVEKQLKEDKFDKPKPNRIVLDKEARELEDKLIEAKRKREIRLLQQQHEQRNAYEKSRDMTLEVLNVPRTIMSSTDFSAPLRQGIVAASAHPVVASKAFVEMFKYAVSQKAFDRWFHEMKESPRYRIMEESKLGISDPHDYRLTAKEEAFMNNLAEKIPFFGKIIKGSERAYVGFLNKMRVDLFNSFADRFEEQGRTIDNSPELYQGIASHINNITGRGGLGNAEAYAPVLNTVFFSPRLIASRFNLLTNWANPKFYKTVPKEVRVEYFKDMAKFVATGMTVLALAKLSGADVEDDPRSSDFGKIKQGNTRYDIWGGFQQYVRLMAQMFSGQKKAVSSGEIQDLGGKGRFGTDRADVAKSFFRGKLAPVPAMGVDFLSGRTVQGDKILYQWGGEHKDQEITLKDVAAEHLLPMIYGDVRDAMKDEGVKALFTVGLPATFGVGVQTYEPAKPPKTFTIYNPANNTKREATQEEFKQYKEIKEKLSTDIAERYKKSGVWINRYGDITLSLTDYVKKKDYNDLTEDEKKDFESKVNSKAAADAKKKFEVKGALERFFEQNPQIKKRIEEAKEAIAPEVNQAKIKAEQSQYKK